MGHTGGYNSRIMVHHSEGYLSEKWAFCAYFMQVAWSKKPELVDSIPEGRSLPYTVVRPRKDPTKGPSKESLGRTDGYNSRITVLHSETYLLQKRAFCAYFVQLAWSKKPELVDSIPEGRSLPYTAIQPRNDPTKGRSRECLGRTDGYNPRITVHHSESYLSQKWAFCVYFV